MNLNLKISENSVTEILRNLNVHRIGPDSSKRNPGDFALWKKREKISEDQEMIWDSPWGTGRPGWHIEDTAITETYFGPQYDIHGEDWILSSPIMKLKLPRWKHHPVKTHGKILDAHRILNVKGEKMSKSLGNFITINELLEKILP